MQQKMPLSAFLIESRIKNQTSFSALGSSTKVDLSDPQCADTFLRTTGVKIENPNASHGAVQYEGEYFLLPEGGLYRSTTPSGWVMLSIPEAEGYSLYIPRSGELHWRAAEGLIHCRSGSAIMLDLARMQQLASLDSSSGTGFFFSMHCMTHNLSQLLEAPVHRQLRFQSPLVHDAHVLAPLASLGELIAEGLGGTAPLKNAPLAMANLLQAASYLILHNLPHNHSHALTRRPPAPAPRQIKRAVEFIMARLSAPITLADIAAHAAISVRSLQSGFRRYKEMTPMEFLRTQRLGRVREDLLDPAVPADIQHIALSWGFTHLYLFMRYYKKQFGESPQATLARRTVKWTGS
ncbi:helix-turn-helix transcriptional regulator [Herbaspirillum camelliae]|uniref:helix-turn-helix transcriptional regulator n=1 Tax=Herbaspirillum camelliae TaxID=1892903 RepID=UPI001E29F2A7|nr:AraC family transcriptional regulator [Herbaspirillum camelliae]